MCNCGQGFEIKGNSERSINCSGKIINRDYFDFEVFSEDVHQNAIEKGFWNGERNDGEMIALMHSELSEALEGLRKPSQSDKIPEFSQVEEEMADVVIRVLDYCKGRKIRLIEAMQAKHRYNKNRERMHGKKF